VRTPGSRTRSRPWQDLIFVQPAAQSGTGNGGARGAAGGGRTLSYQDGEALAAASLPGSKGSRQDSGNAQLISPATNQFVSIIATVPAYLDVRGSKLLTGPSSPKTTRKKNLVIVLGSDLANTLFPMADLSDRPSEFRAGRTTSASKVVGVLAQRAASGGGATDTYDICPDDGALAPQNDRSANGNLYIDQLNIQKLPAADNSTVVARSATSSTSAIS